MQVRKLERRIWIGKGTSKREGCSSTRTQRDVKELERRGGERMKEREETGQRWKSKEGEEEGKEGRAWV